LLDSPAEVATVVDAAREHAKRNFAMPTFVAAVDAQLSAAATSHRPRFAFSRARQVRA
jgi:hypothetical protein